MFTYLKTEELFLDTILKKSVQYFYTKVIIFLFVRNGFAQKLLWIEKFPFSVDVFLHNNTAGVT